MSFRKPITIRRKKPGFYEKGIWVEGSESTFTILANVQPMKPEEVLCLPEGRRETAAIILYTDSALMCVGKQNCDTVDWFDSLYEVISIEPWQSGIINHFKVIGVRI